MTELKVKFEEVIGANQALMGLAGVKMPVSISVGLSDLADSFESKAKTYDKEMKKLMDEFCEKDDEGKYVPVDTAKPELGYKLANKEAYFMGVEELKQTEVPILFNPIDLGNLEIEFGIVKMLRKFMKTQE